MRNLSPRQHEIFQRLLAGENDKMIAAALNISPRTVMTHVQRAVRRLGANHRAHAAAIYCVR